MNAKKILVIDGQGGKLGRELVERILTRFPEVSLTAVGTNSAATAAMMKGGARQAATGENAVCVAARKADVILAPLGAVIADALIGEISPTMAAAVGQSDAVCILIPSNKCDHLVAGIGNASVSDLLDDAMRKLEQVLSGD